MARVRLCARIAGVAIWLLLAPTTAMAEYDVKSALQGPMQIIVRCGNSFSETHIMA
jgi:hypothetical protein